jgi:hypothetical protein
MVLDDIFPTFSDFIKIIPGVDSTLDFKTLNSSAISAKKQIVSLISLPVFNGALQADDQKEMLQQALGNLTMAKDAAFDVLRKRKSNIDVYKSEQEAIRRQYFDNFYNAMDSLIELLDKAASEEWTSTSYHSLLEDLRIKSMDKFNNLYPIDNSYLFFFRCIPLQKEVLDLQIETYYQLIDESGKTNLTNNMDRALVLYTVALALQRFDIMEFPLTIRNLVEESNVTTRLASGEQDRLLVMSDSLSQQADGILQSVNGILSEDDNKNNDVDVTTSFNRKDDKIYLLP